MPYYIALPNENGFSIVSESFEIRSNAIAYARRMGWEKICFIATGEQRGMIEGNTASFNIETSGSGYRIAPSPVAEPDATWMKEEGLPWNKALRHKKKKK